MVYACARKKSVSKKFSYSDQALKNLIAIIEGTSSLDMTADAVQGMTDRQADEYLKLLVRVAIIQRRNELMSCPANHLPI